MLLKLLALLVVLGAVSLAEPTSRGLCPKFCKCTYSGNSQGVARCTTLDLDTQHYFPQDIRHLVVENDPNPKNITDSFFLNLGLKKLATVKIVNSSVLNLNVGAFKGLTQLTNVDLSENRLMLIHPDTFKNNTELRRLILSGNPLQLTQLLLPIGEYVLRSDSLTELYLSKCQMNHLSDHAFSELGNLDVLDLSHNNIRTINPNVFMGLDQLEEINLSFNHLSTIPPDTFIIIEDLTSLILRGNPLQTFDLPNLPELRELDLSQCQFTYLGPTTFEGVIDVSTLNLSHNAIEKIDADAFDAMTNLRYVDLSFNELKGPLNMFLFQPTPNIETISLAGNKDLKTLDEFVGEFSSLYLYDISDCGLTSLSGKMFKGMHYLATLNISGNNIQRVEPTAFSGLTHINVLDLSENHIQSLHTSIFASNHEMSKLYLSGNLIHHLPAPVFRPLTKLYVLDLSYNMMSTLWNHTEMDNMQIKKILSELTHLNVAGNYIKHLHVFNFLSMVNLQVLDISQNPLECTRNFIKVVKWLSAHRVLPDGETLNHPVSMIQDDQIENYRKWVTMLDETCPVDLESFDEVTTTPVAHPEEKENHLQDLDDPEVKLSKITDAKPAEEIRDEGKGVDYVHSKLFDTDFSKNSRYELLELQEETSEWPTLLLVCVFCVFVSVAFINIGLIMFFRARRNYSLVGYKSTFSGGPMPQSRFPLRKGQRNAYQKLYEECSVPNTPIVKNGKRLGIVSIFGSQIEVPPQPV